MDSPLFQTFGVDDHTGHPPTMPIPQILSKEESEPSTRLARLAGPAPPEYVHHLNGTPTFLVEDSHRTTATAYLIQSAGSSATGLNCRSVLVCSSAASITLLNVCINVRSVSKSSSFVPSGNQYNPLFRWCPGARTASALTPRILSNARSRSFPSRLSSALSALGSCGFSFRRLLILEEVATRVIKA